MEWTNNHDLALAREVLLLEPYRQVRTIERGKVWQTIADNLNSHATLRFLVTKKSVREHLKLLLDKYRQKACEKLGEMMKRKEDEGLSEPKKKRSRKGGNDTIEFLREKANIDMAMKQEEQKARREEHERQTRLYELALANQQQQQHQSNQLMSLMIGLMQKIAEK